MTIRFYSVKGAQYGCFSNFSRHGFNAKGKFWLTSEHYFQAMKFEGTKHEDEIRNAPSARGAADKGRERTRPLRKDWDTPSQTMPGFLVKDEVMFEAIEYKFRQNKDAYDILMSTGDEHIIEAAPNDYYWGAGRDGSGKNMLGILLVKLREKFKAEAAIERF